MVGRVRRRGATELRERLGSSAVTEEVKKEVFGGDKDGSERERLRDWRRRGLGGLD